MRTHGIWQVFLCQLVHIIVILLSLRSFSSEITFKITDIQIVIFKNKIKQNSLLGLGVEFRPEWLLLFAVPPNAVQDQAGADSMAPTSLEGSIQTKPYKAAVCPENRGQGTTLGPGVRAGFLGNVRPRPRAEGKSKRIKSRCNKKKKKKADLATYKPRAKALSSLFRRRRPCVVIRAGCSLSRGDPVVSFLLFAV